jgi:hypothetical protein
MSLIRATCRTGLWCLALWAVVAAATRPVFAQDLTVPTADVVAVGAGIDVANDYVFRGVRQNSTGVVVWPFADFTARVLSREGPLKRVTVNVGTWNSLNSGDTGSDGPMKKAWYESRLRGGVDVHLGRGVSVGTSYTAYLSPNQLFTTAKEIGIRVAIDDGQSLGRAAIHPYALMAIEVDTAPGAGQLDGGLHAGRYLEVGASPGYSAKRVNLTVPIKVGLSLRNYYELGNVDNRFGFASIGGYVSVPLGGVSKVGRWHVRGGLDVLRFGETTSRFNGGDHFQTTASVGITVRR